MGGINYYFYYLKMVKRLRDGDTVTTEAYRWGEDDAKKHFPDTWRTAKYTGTICERKGAVAICEFDMLDGSSFSVELPVKHLAYSDAVARAMVAESDEDFDPELEVEDVLSDGGSPQASGKNAEEEQSAVCEDEEEDVDSLDSSSVSSGVSSAEDSSDDDNNVSISEAGIKHAEGWEEVTSLPVDPRILAGYSAVRKATIKVNDADVIPFTEYVKMVMPMDFITKWAEKIQRKGRIRYSKGFTCTVNDLMHWHGCYAYFMVWPDHGVEERKKYKYWPSALDDREFGPLHDLSPYI